MRLPRLPLVLLLLSIASCSRESSPVGVDLLPENDFVGVHTFDSVADSAAATSSTFVKPITAASSTIISIGRTGEYTSYAMLRWLYLPDSLGQRGRIVEARMSLRPLDYHIGDGQVPLQFDVRKIDDYWSSFTFTSDSLAQLQLDPAVKGTFSGVIQDTTSITVDVDTAMAREWLMLAASGKTYEIRGVLLDPTAYQSNVRGFQSAFGDVPPRFHIVLEYDGILDTIRGEALENTYVATGPPIDGTGSMTLHGGLAYRGKLHVDVSGIPPRSIINNVKLYLTRDSLKTTRNYRGIDTILVYVSTNAETNAIPSNGTTTRIGSNPHEFIAEGGLLINAVQGWISGKPNHGFVLVRLAEVSDLDQTQFYGADAPDEKRPRLEITYTTEP